MINKTPRYFYTKQRNHSRERGIDFNLSFEEWLDIWEKALGPDWMLKRGKGFGKSCMTRPNDKGAYEIGNVVIKTHSENGYERAGRRYYIKTKNLSLSGQIKMWEKEFEKKESLWYWI